MRELIAMDYFPSPEEISSWLSSHDWTRRGHSLQRPVLWVQGNREILQPSIRDAHDYELRLSELLSSLAIWTQKSVDALVVEMVHESSDVAEWRATGDMVRNFTIPLQDGVILVSGVRDAVVAAANATMQRRGYFGHSSLKAAREQARAVRMGQTRRGSYVVPIISRIDGAGVEERMEREARLDVQVSAQPFGRRVLSLLAEALKQIQELAVTSEKEPTHREVNESVSAGVSYELCTALDAILSADLLEVFDVSFAWARRASGHPDVSQVQFPSQARPVVRRMAQFLRGSDVIAEQVVSGMVWQTTHQPGDEEGRIKIRTQIGTNLKTVSAPLSRVQIREAHAAAADERPVFIKGQMVREQGRMWHFESVSEFGVAEAVPLSWTDPAN